MVELEGVGRGARRVRGGVDAEVGGVARGAHEQGHLCTHILGRGKSALP